MLVCCIADVMAVYVIPCCACVATDSLAVPGHWVITGFARCLFVLMSFEWLSIMNSM